MRKILSETGIPSRALAIETIEFPFKMTLALAEMLDLVRVVPRDQRAERLLDFLGTGGRRQFEVLVVGLLGHSTS